jgi:hypothetical protein
MIHDGRLSGPALTGWAVFHAIATAGIRERAGSAATRSRSATQSGSVWALEDGTWHELASDLPPVLSTEVGAGP